MVRGPFLLQSLFFIGLVHGQNGIVVFLCNLECEFSNKLQARIDANSDNNKRDDDGGGVYDHDCIVMYVLFAGSRDETKDAIMDPLLFRASCDGCC